MTDKEWEQFFALLTKVSTPDPGQSWQERKKMIVDLATEGEYVGRLEEFLDWFDGDL